MHAIVDNTEITGSNKRAATVSTDETYWGYIVRCQTCDRSLAIVAQWIAAFFGVLLLVAALGFWVLPGSVMSSDVAGLKLGMSVLSGVIGVTLIWFASHGTQSEFQVDLARVELRQVLRDSKGRARVQNRTGFADVGSVFIDRTTPQNGKFRLLLRLGNSTEVIEVARDYEEHLTRLRDRLGRDILGDMVVMQTKPNRGFILGGATGVVVPEVAA